MSDRLQLLSIGMITGGPEPTPIDETIRRIATLLAEIQTTTAGLFQRSEGELNVVFHLPGRLIRPSFRGLRTAKVSRKQKTLMVQVAVPDSIVDSRDEEFVAQSLKDAVRLTVPVFARTAIPFVEEEFVRVIVRAMQASTKD